MDLSDGQWAILGRMFQLKRRSDGRGGPWRDTRAVLRGPNQTCHRRFQSWQRSGLLTRVLRKPGEDLRDRGKIGLSETFIDASFGSAKNSVLIVDDRHLIRHRIRMLLE
jgi:hypothetical protein